jgi:hypothetical protein
MAVICHFEFFGLTSTNPHTDAGMTAVKYFSKVRRLKRSLEGVELGNWKGVRSIGSKKITDLGNIYQCKYRVARWLIRVPKIPVWVHFREALEVIMLVVYFMTIWYSLWPFGTFYGNVVHFMAMWYILCSFGTYTFLPTFGLL